MSPTRSMSNELVVYKDTASDGLRGIGWTVHDGQCHIC